MPIFTTAITGSDGSGVVQVTGSVNTSGIIAGLGIANAQTASAQVNIPSRYNAVLYGPITVDTNGTLYISGSAVVKIKDIEDV